MTWTATLTVQDVGEGPAPLDVLAVAEGDAIISNTEGALRSIEVRFVLDQDETTLKPGDLLHVTGHWS